jgi:hypothetical protein
VYRNLGNTMSPNGPPYLEFIDVCHIHGKSISLFVNNLTKYTPFRAHKTGFDKKWAFANINLAEGSDVLLEFSFKETLTKKPIVLDNFYFTIFDVDHGEGQNERVTVEGFHNYTMLKDAVMNVVHNPIGYHNFSFTSLQKGDASNNPTSETEMTHQQMQLSVSFLFRRTDRFRVKFELSSKYRIAGRNFMFKGISSLTWQCGDLIQYPTPIPTPAPTPLPTPPTPAPTPAPTPKPCGPPQTCDLHFSKENLVYRNLGNTMSPNGPPHLEFKNACTFGGKEVSLYVRNLTKYTPFKAHKTGICDKWGFANINLAEGSSTMLEFSLRETKSQKPIKLENFYFTIFDLDHGAGQSERVYVEGFKNFTLVKNSIMEVIEHGPNNATFISRKEAGAGNNPTSSHDLTDEQMRIAMSFLFQNVDKFLVRMELLSKYRDAGRNFMFKGISTLTWHCHE